MRFLTRLHSWLLIICLAHLQPSQGAAVIFDLNGVFFTTNLTACMRQLGMGNIIRYQMTTKKGASQLKKKLYEVMNSLYPTTMQAGPCDDEGIPLPAIMQAWNKGNLDHEEILSLIKDYIADYPNTFVNKVEQTLVWRLANLIFNPTHFVATRTLIANMVTFALECKAAGHQLYILSNWDPVSFELLHTQYAEFFDHFDGIIISGNYGMMKPDPAIFKTLTRLYNLTPQSCIFIDDQKENIAAAHAFGMHTIWCPHTHSLTTRNRPDIAFVRKKYNLIMELLLPDGM